MKKWDYQERETSGKGAIQTAKGEGLNGWELVAVIPFAPPDYRVRLVFKREIPETATPAIPPALDDDTNPPDPDS